MHLKEVEIRSSMQAIFNDSQIGLHGHMRCIKKLRKIYDMSCRASDKAVRFRCCEMVSRLLDNLGDEASLDNNLYERIYDTMLERVRDKVPAVRAHAVLALRRLQDPTDKECPVGSAYLFLLVRDPNPEVRANVLRSIGATLYNIDAVMQRTRDVNELVRKLAYQVVAEKINVKGMSIRKRVALLQSGLNDRSEAVREACSSHLIQSWLRAVNNDIVKLLALLDLDLEPIDADQEKQCKLAEQMLRTIFVKIPSHELVEQFQLLDESKTIPVDRLSAEKAVYWRCLCLYMSEMGEEGEEYLERLLPNATPFCGYVEQVVNGLTRDHEIEDPHKLFFTIHQLLRLAHLLDLTDEMGRKTLDALLRKGFT